MGQLAGYSTREKAKQAHTSRQNEKEKINRKKQKEGGLEAAQHQAAREAAFELSTTSMKLAKLVGKLPAYTQHRPSLISLGLHGTANHPSGSGKHRWRVPGSTPRGHPEENLGTRANFNKHSLPRRSALIRGRYLVMGKLGL